MIHFCSHGLLRYDTIQEFDVDWKTDYDQLNLAHVTKNKIPGWLIKCPQLVSFKRAYLTSLWRNASVIVFHWSTKKLTRIRWIIPYYECRWLYPGSDTTQKRRNTREQTTETRLHSCWWLGVVFSRSQSLALLHLRYPAGSGVRRPSTSVRKSTGLRRDYHKQMERGFPRDSSKIHCTIANTIEFT